MSIDVVNARFRVAARGRHTISHRVVKSTGVLNFVGVIDPCAIKTNEYSYSSTRTPLPNKNILIYTRETAVVCYCTTTFCLT